MAQKKRNEILVGAFVAGGGVLFLLLLFLMGTLDRVFASWTIVDVEFGDVQGLQPGDHVLMFGNRVGKVSKIELEPKDAQKRAVVRVSLRIPERYRAYLRKDSLVRIDKQITGNNSVLIQESEGEPLPEGGRLTGTPTGDLASGMQKANLLLEEGREVVATISRVVKDLETRGDVSRALGEARGLLENLNAKVLPLSDRLKQAIEELQGILSENRLDLRHMVANLRETSGAAKSFTEKITQTPEQLARSLSELEKAGSAVGALVRENRTNVDTILEDLRAAMTNASSLTSEIKRRPWRLLYRPTEEELKAMDLYDAAWAYNLGATELNRSIRDLTARVEADPTGAARPEALEEARRQIAHSLRRHREAEDKFWEKLKASE